MLNQLGKAASFVVVLCASVCALAMAPPELYRDARLDATSHVQVEVMKVKTTSQPWGECEVSGRVVRIFKDLSKDLELGKTLHFRVPCISRSARPPLGGALWKQKAALESAKFMELYLENGEVPMSQCAVIPLPTDEPTCPPETGGVMQPNPEMLPPLTETTP